MQTTPEVAIHELLSQMLVLVSPASHSVLIPSNANKNVNFQPPSILLVAIRGYSLQSSRGSSSYKSLHKWQCDVCTCLSNKYQWLVVCLIGSVLYLSTRYHTSNQTRSGLCRPQPYSARLNMSGCIDTMNTCMCTSLLF